LSDSIPTIRMNRKDGMKGKKFIKAAEKSRTGTNENDE
jgi:hypothetical protein